LLICGSASLFMKYLFNTLLLSCFLLGIFTIYAFPGENLNDLKTYLKQKSKFNAEETGSLIKLLEESSKEGLPAELLSSKIKEGVKRGVGYQKVIAALKNKIENTKTAQKLVKNALDRNIEIRNTGYSLKALSELMDAGLSETDWNELSEKLFIQKTFPKSTLEDAIAVNSAYLNIIKTIMSEKSAKEIILAAENSNMKRKEIEMLSLMIEDAVVENHIGTDEVRNTIMENINRRKGIGQIRQEILNLTGKSKGKPENSREE
jgi:hypothetical protein